MGLSFSRSSGTQNPVGVVLGSAMLIGAGAWLIYHAWDVYTQTTELLPAGIFAAGGLFFLGGGMNIVRGWRAGRAEAARLEARREEFADEPWKIRPEWWDGHFEAKPDGNRGLGLLAIFWNLVSWPVAVSVLRSEFSSPSPDRQALLVLLFPAVGLLLAGIALRGVLRRRKYGTTEIELDTLPVPLGGRIVGRVVTGIEPRDAPPDGFRVMLSCYRRRVTRSGSGSNSSRRVEMDLLWRDEKTMKGVPHDARTRLMVPISFELPDDQPESTAEPTPSRTLWQVEVSAEMPGLDYAAEVEIPVFDLGDGAGEADSGDPSAVGAAASAGFAAQDSSPEDPYAEYEIGAGLAGPRSPGIELRTPAPGRIEFFFDRARDKGAIAMSASVGAGCLGVLVWAVVAGQSPGILFLLIVGLVGAAFTYLAYRLWTFTSTLTVDGERIQLVRGPFGRGEPVVIPSSELTDVRVKVGGRTGSGAGSRASYELVLERVASDEERLTHEEQMERFRSLADTLGLESDDDVPLSEALSNSSSKLRPTVNVAGSLRDKQEADWIALRIMEAAVGRRAEGGQVERP